MFPAAGAALQSPKLGVAPVLSSLDVLELSTSRRQPLTTTAVPIQARSWYFKRGVSIERIPSRNSGALFTRLESRPLRNTEKEA